MASFPSASVRTLDASSGAARVAFPGRAIADFVMRRWSLLRVVPLLALLALIGYLGTMTADDSPVSLPRPAAVAR